MTRRPSTPSMRENLPLILVVDDDPAMCEVLEEGLGEQGYRVESCTRPEAALTRLQGDPVDALVADLNMPGLDGLALCQAAMAVQPDLPVIVITAFGSMEAAIGALRVGAWDFVTKPLEPEDLARSLKRAVEVNRLRREVRSLRRAVREAGRFEDLLGSSPAMGGVFTLLDRLSDSDATVLICGETGTGKELVARALHARSLRARGPFVAFNGAALPESLVEGELFGHVRGAFTDARGSRVGLLFEAHGGTLFLDEVAEIPLSVQPKLLRALQERVARPLGSEREMPFDVRIVAATHRDLEAEVEAGRFRKDLYYRLAVVEVDLPPLKARGNDILLLAQHFVDMIAARGRRRVTGISAEAARALLDWTWPGNVRELQNVVERAVALCPGPEIGLGDLPERLRSAPPSSSRELLPEELPTLEEVERQHIQRVLRAVGGSKSQAARILGLDRATLYRRLGRDAER